MRIPRAMIGTAYSKIRFDSILSRRESTFKFFVLTSFDDDDDDHMSKAQNRNAQAVPLFGLSLSRATGSAAGGRTTKSYKID
jgi:hypothetical protein